MLKSKSKAQQLLQNLDFFGQPVQLFFDGAALHKTVFGGIITLLIIFVLLALVIILVVGLFARKTYTTSIEKVFNVNPGFLDLSKGFMFSIGVQDPGISLSNSIFSYTLTGSTFVNTGGVIVQTKQISIPLHPCTLNDYLNFTDEYNQFQLNTTMCPDLTNISLQGKYFSPLFTYIKMNVSKCINGTNIGITCASDDFIQSYFTNSQKIRIVLYFINSVVDLDNYQNPFIDKFIDDLDWVISPDSALRISTDVYFQTSIVNSLDNIFGIGDGWNTSTIGYQRFKNDHSFMPNTTKFNEYLEIFFRADSYDTLTIRKYETVPQILSILGGIWNILYLVLGCLAAQYNKELFKIDLANVLYDFDTIASGVNEQGDEDESDYNNDGNSDVGGTGAGGTGSGGGNGDDENAKDNGGGLKKNNTSQNLLDLNENTIKINFVNLSQKQANTNNNPNIIDESSANMLTNADFHTKFNSLRSRRRILKYSGKDLWTSMFNCCSKKKVKNKNLLLNKANSKLAGDIDIRIILKRLKEVNDIKNAVFDQHQLAIFNFVPHELITLEKEGTDEQIRKIHLAQQAKFLKNQLNNLCCKQDEYLFRHISYNILKTRNDTISQNIVRKLDQEIKEIFEFLDEKKNQLNLNVSNNIEATIHPKFIKYDIKSQHSKKSSISSSKSIIQSTQVNQKPPENPIFISYPESQARINDPDTYQDENLAHSSINENKTNTNEDSKSLTTPKPSVLHIKSSFGLKLLESIQPNDPLKTKYMISNESNSHSSPDSKTKGANGNNHLKKLDNSRQAEDSSDQSIEEIQKVKNHHEKENIRVGSNQNSIELTIMGKKGLKEVSTILEENNTNTGESNNKGYYVNKNKLLEELNMKGDKENKIEKNSGNYGDGAGDSGGGGGNIHKDEEQPRDKEIVGRQEDENSQVNKG